MSLLVDEPLFISAAPEASRRLERLRVLVSAYAVSPAEGSEPGLGWNVCSRLAAHHDVTVLCAPGCAGEDRSAFRRAIDAHGPVAGMTVHYVPHPALSRLFQRENGVARRTVYYAGYAAWQRAAFRAARELHERHPFDLVHHLNITGYREPGYLWKLDAPFVWGPVGGASDVPWSFLPLMSWPDRCYYVARNVINAVQMRTARRCRRAAERAAHVWAIGEDNRRMVERRWGRDAEAVIESGAAVVPGVTPRRCDGRRPLRVVWSGHHLGRKALPVLLRAIAVAPAVDVECVILGAGPETGRWQAEAESLGIAGRVRWTGMLSRDAALDEVRRADVMAFTGVQEGTPHAVLEALSLGVPVVCHDACGMAVAVDGTCGIKVPMQSPAVSVGAFAAALAHLASRPDEVHRLSVGAIERASELSWDTMAAAMAETYRRVAAGVRA